MMRRWLTDAADRLEAAAELARDLRATRGPVVEGVRIRTDFLAERLWETARRLGLVQSLGPDARARLALRLCDLYRVARRAQVLAQAEGYAALSEGLGAIASEVRTLVAEVAVFDDAGDETQAVSGACR
jgi:hypothetical protein